MSNSIEKRSLQERLIIAKTLLDGVIKDLPSAQPEIIRCGECLMHGVCRFEIGLGENGFCSQGKKGDKDE